MTERHSRRSLRLSAALTLGVAWLLLACLSTVAAQSQSPSTQPAEVPVQSSTPTVQPPPTSKAWQQLTPKQKQALAPLGAQWGALTPQQQNKWLAISTNFTQLSVADQITMHARMADWVALSPQQRNLARLNFNKLQNLPKEDKKAKWEAYQALPAEEKRLLSAGSKALRKNAAPTAKPLESRRQVQTPAKVAPGSAPAATIAIDRKTLLPRPAAMAAPAPDAPTPSTTGTPGGVRQATETAPS